MIIIKNSYFFGSKGVFNCMLLNIICTRNTAMSKRNTEAGFPVWFMDETTGRLIIYEDEPENFRDSGSCLRILMYHSMPRVYRERVKEIKNSFLLM